MLGVMNRLPHVVYEVGTCFTVATYTEYVTVIPGNPDMRNERHQFEIVLCRQRDVEFTVNGLHGTITAYGDQIVGEVS